MSAPQGNDGGEHNPLPNLASLSVGNENAAQRRLALARAARENATREEIEARGIRPDVQQIIRHMNETPAHSLKRARLNNSTARRIYTSKGKDVESDNGEEEDEDEEDDDTEHSRREQEAREEAQFEEQWQSLLAEEGLQDANMFLLDQFRRLARQRIRVLQRATAKWTALCSPPPMDDFDLVGSLCTCTELIVEVCKHMRPIDIVHLYSVSKDFHRTINEHMRSSIFAWASSMAPTAARIYSSPVYCRWFIRDPAGRTVTRLDQELSKTQPGQAKVAGQPPLNGVEGQVRLIPGLLWLQMVVNREIRVRDIVATLARMGHRLPEGSHLTLKKIWLVMDAATTQARMMLMNNPDFFTNEDMYMAQLFMVKLVLAFNDPVFGPQSTMLMRLMMGQRGLSPLWALLRGKKYRSPEEIRQLKLRYDVGPDQVNATDGMPVHGVEVDQLGVMHFEGWGTGPDHLMRPDELVPLEAARRQLDLDTCIEEMLIYGHVDFRTGNSLVPSLDEMYMSDDELSPALKDWKPLRNEPIHSGCGNVPFEASMWQPKHARKARWKTLTAEEKAMILEEEQREMDELNELDGAQARFHDAWANLALLASRATRQRQMRAKFKLLQPSLDDMEAELAAFERPARASSHAITAVRTTTAVHHPSAMDLDAVARRTTSSPLPRASKRQHSSSDLDDSDLDMLDLTLEPIPPRELRRIFAAFRPRTGRPQDEESSEEEEEEEEEEEQDEYQYQDQDTHMANSASTAGSEASTIPDDDDDDDDDEPLPHPPLYNLALTPVTSAPSVNTDEMLLAQADLAYSDDEDDDGYDDEEEVEDAAAAGGGGGGTDGGVGGGGGEFGHAYAAEDNSMSMMGEGGGGGGGGEQAAAVAGAGGAWGEIDWDDFLRHPAAYAVDEEAEEVEGEAEGGAAPQGGDGDVEMGGQQQDGQAQGGGGGDGDGDAEGAEEIRADDELTRYMVDEDVGEDDRTKKLRDWFRPW